MSFSLALAVLFTVAAPQFRGDARPPIAVFRGAEVQATQANWFAGLWDEEDFHLELERTPDRLRISTGKIDGYSNHVVDLDLSVEDGVLVVRAKTRGANCMSVDEYYSSDAHGTIKLSASGKRHWLEYDIVAVESAFGSAESTMLRGGVRVKLDARIRAALQSVPEWSAAGSVASRTANELSETWYANGTLRCRGEVDEFGRRQGLWRTFAADGTPISESGFTDGIRDGAWVGFTDEGGVHSIGQYEMGVPVGEWVTDWAGSTECGTYRHGVKFGRWERYVGPQLLAHKSYLFGMEFGHARVTYSDGMVRAEGVYLDGDPVGWWAYRIEDSDQVETRYRQSWSWEKIGARHRGLAWLEVIFGLREL